ncbi:branched-chain amino acid ABC transporter permease [Lichenihabitans psoromatis]|uniref:branched-chain amino acid ABC transporter permease n=1 Tax=Lichenihabitans psoromatis TaxID=2528642 RepID=UPI0010358E80|nr:branched-chain amino acid ABC transporter permease [Lichenihabitans psoromatis]
MGLSTLIAILTAGLTNGAIYALATIGLALVWGSMGMLNMAHGALLALGGYAAYSTVTTLGLPAPFGFVGAILVGVAAGAVLYGTVVRQLLRQPVATFETNVLIATVGIGIALENAILHVYGGQPLRQPVVMDGLIRIGVSEIPVQNVAIVGVSLVMMGLVAWLLARTRMGRAIRATAQNREAAQLMGVPTGRVYLQVLMLSGLLAGVCGVLVSSITQLSPPLGGDPMLKAFIMCVVAGLGNLPGAVVSAFVLALVEAFVQFGAGARWGFPVLLLLVIVVLIWRPSGLFGRVQTRRL